MSDSTKQTATEVTSPWNVLHVVAKHEKKVVQHLEARSLEHYLPLYKDQSQWSDRKVIVERPLFVGYVFVRYARAKRRLLLSVPGILHVLGDTENEAVSAEEIEQIRNGLSFGYKIRPYQGAVVGDLVRVRRGVFVGAQGIITKMSTQCRVVMKLQATQQLFSVELEQDDIEILRHLRHGSDKENSIGEHGRECA